MFTLYVACNQNMASKRKSKPNPVVKRKLWTAESMNAAVDSVLKVIERHKSIGYLLPKFLYTDCSVCNEKPGSPRVDSGTSVAALWRSIFNVKLDTMHLMLQGGKGLREASRLYNISLQRRVTGAVELGARHAH